MRGSCHRAHSCTPRRSRSRCQRGHWRGGPPQRPTPPHPCHDTRFERTPSHGQVQERVQEEAQEVRTGPQGSRGAVTDQPSAPSPWRPPPCLLLACLPPACFPPLPPLVPLVPLLLPLPLPLPWPPPAWACRPGALALPSGGALHPRGGLRAWLRPPNWPPKECQPVGCSRREEWATLGRTVPYTVLCIVL